MVQPQDMNVARAVFTSALLRTEPNAPEISRDDATLFARTLLKTCNICTTANIKLCTSFIVKFVLSSKSRTAALAKYLVNLSKSLGPRDPETRVDTTKTGDEDEGLGKIVNGKVQQPPEPAFKRLHILYVVHDALSHVHRHDKARQEYLKAVLEHIHSDILALVELATCGCGGLIARTAPLVMNLLAFWKQNEIFSPDQTDHMRDSVLTADGMEWEAMLTKLIQNEESKVHDLRRQREEDGKWMLPDRHGVINDPTAPWHELPAANGLYLKRTRGYPLRASAIPPGGAYLQNGGEEADPQLKKDVANLYTELIHCYDKYTNADEVQDIDALGNIIWKDPERPTRNYWGFTLDGIEKRKVLAEQFVESANGYDDYGRGSRSMQRVDDAVERARILAAERGGGVGRGRGGMARAGWRGGRNW